MLIFNCTKSAAYFFTIKKNGVKSSPIKPVPDIPIYCRNKNGKLYSQWVLNTVRVPECNRLALVAMEVNSRYSMVFPTLIAGDVREFLRLFFERLSNIMFNTCENINIHKQIDHHNMILNFLEHNKDYHFCIRSDNSVTAHITDVSYHFNRKVREKGCLPETNEQAATFDEFVNNLYRRSKNNPEYFVPYEEMIISFIKNYAHASQKIIDTAKINFLSVHYDILEHEI